LKTASEYIENVKKLKPNVYLNGRRVDSILENPVTKTIVDSMAKIYEMTQDPEYKNVMTAYSPLIKDEISRCVLIFQNREDLEKRVEMAILTSFLCAHGNSLKHALIHILFRYGIDKVMKIRYHEIRSM